MLSKCANPSCSTTFRYLHEGRLYVIDPRGALAGHKPICSTKSGQLEYAWLCSSCSLYLTIRIDEELGTRVVWKFVAKNDSSAVHQLMTAPTPTLPKEGLKRRRYASSTSRVTSARHVGS